VLNGVDLSSFDAARLAAERNPARERLTVAEDLVFLAVAHNPRLKEIDTAIRATAALKAQGYRGRLVVAGAPPSTSFVSLAQALGVRNEVLFTGLVEDMLPLYAAVDVLVHPTRWDACSLVVLEGLAAGLPVITTAANGAAAAIRDGENGLVLAQPNDVERLAQRMGALVRANLRPRMGEAARLSSLSLDRRANYRAVEQLLIG
jgi:UDP-glucose:(heptosyl)LPS alpha-1,3-glucosyltransferase